MKPYILEGSPHEVAQRIESIAARNVVAVIVVDEASAQETVGNPTSDEFARLWAECERDTVSVGHVDDSREAIYTRMPGE